MSKYSAYEDQHYNCSCCQEDTITCKPVTVVTTTGKVLGEAEAGEKFKVGDSTITNSIDTYEYNLPATVDLELPDIPHVDSNGDIVPTPAQVPFVCTTVSIPSNVINTEGDLLGQTDPPNDFIAPDATIDINGGFFFDVPSGNTDNIEIIDSGGATIPIVSQTTDTVEVEVPLQNAYYEVVNTTPTLIDSGAIMSGVTSTITLADTNYEITVDGVTEATGAFATAEDFTLNITL